MKLFYTFLISVFFLNLGLSQEIIYQEDFEANSIPDGYIIVDRDGYTVHPNVGWVNNDAWIFESGSAISTSWYTSAAASDDWMITTEIALPTIDDPENKALKLMWYEYTPDQSYRDGYVIYVNDDPTKTDPADFTEQIFSTGAAATEWTLKQADLTDYAGKSVRLAFVNNSFDKYLLFIDNILIVSPSKNDMVLQSVNDPSYLKSNTNYFNVTVQSLGFETAQTFDIAYSIDGGAPVVKTFSNAGFNFLTEKNLNVDVSGLTTGMHDVEYWVENINGGQTDENTANDTISKQIYVYGPEAETGRTTILEVFTSSTCPPCKPGNEKIKAIVNNMNIKPILLKYQQDFPGAGDPYTTDETVSRRLFYGINAIPETRIDGSFYAINPNSLTTIMISQARNEGALVDINASYTLYRDEQKIRVYGNITPNVDMLPGAAMQVIIKEMVTYNNIESNGETIFDNIVKKMIGGAEGIDVGGVKAGETQDFDFTFEFKGDYRLPADGQAFNRINFNTEHSVENFDNLAATIFVEFAEDEFIMQAQEADFVNEVEKVSLIDDFNLYPNPVEANFVNLDFVTKEKSAVQVLITDLNGRTVKKIQLGQLQEGTHNKRIDVSDLENGMYDISVLTNNLNGISKILYVYR
jgi:thiol-disulfide isomerase/thioredoxin